MFTSLEQKRLPRHAILSDDAVERYARITQKGAYNLLPTERFWQERQQHLQRHGYLLRPRYSPRWQPSWIGTNWDPTFCEDSIMSHVGQQKPRFVERIFSYISPLLYLFIGRWGHRC